MSKSRLEKFLYALYSLDSSDLPNPLSRIEELYKRWVTGEEPPTFEPLSRVEKYLMAILGAYNVNELPNPLSRVEVLLYKLATGDDNLDDIKSFLSEHEELLAEIIRNGGVGGNINIEYVLYTLSTEHNTLYNTAEKPVKSAILKGSTKYRDIDTGEILEAFEEGRNLELVSVKMPVLTTNSSNLIPLKSNILTTPEDVTLRGIGTTFKDELNLLTGELTKRVGEIVFDGSENWSITSFNASNTECVIFVTEISDKTSNWRYSCDRFKTGIADVARVENVEGVCSGGGPTSFFINMSKTKASTVAEFKNWLSNNNVTLQYQSVESVKTVDLSVVDQDGNNTKLSTFDDLTHVTLSSEGLIPEVELEVATKNEEVLNTMSLEMDGISTSQNTLEETANTQSENVDATMIATTEIYEELL